jgi:choline kinase
VMEVARKVGQNIRPRGEAVGMLRLSAEAAEVLRGILDELVEGGKDSADYQDAIRDLAVEVPIGVVEVGDLPWIGIDVEEDLIRARQQILPQVERLDRGESLPAA